MKTTSNTAVEGGETGEARPLAERRLVIFLAGLVLGIMCNLKVSCSIVHEAEPESGGDVSEASPRSDSANAGEDARR